MASKYLASGTPTYTAATRTIDGGTMSVAFASTDVGKAVTFIQSGVVYFGTVKTVTDGDTIILEQGAGLPAGNGTLTQLILLDTATAHAYASYLAEIESKVAQDVERVAIAGRKACLSEALTIYNHDKPYTVPIRISGNGTSSINLGSALGSWWTPGVSRIGRVEYPAAQNPPEFLPEDRWTLYSDGTTQDGTGKQLRFQFETPGAGEYIVLHVITPRTLPEIGAQNFPDTDQEYSNITTMAGCLLCERLAAAFAQSSNGSISADVIDYHGKTEKYKALAKSLKERYNSAVFGSPDGASDVQPAVVEKRIDTTTSLGGSYLFHRRIR